MAATVDAAPAREVMTSDSLELPPPLPPPVCADVAPLLLALLVTSADGSVMTEEAVARGEGTPSGRCHPDAVNATDEARDGDSDEEAAGYAGWRPAAIRALTPPPASRGAARTAVEEVGDTEPEDTPVDGAASDEKVGTSVPVPPVGPLLLLSELPAPLPPRPGKSDTAASPRSFPGAAGDGPSRANTEGTAGEPGAEAVTRFPPEGKTTVPGADALVALLVPEAEAAAPAVVVAASAVPASPAAVPAAEPAMPVLARRRRSSLAAMSSSERRPRASRSTSHVVTVVARSAWVLAWRRARSSCSRALRSSLARPSWEVCGAEKAERAMVRWLTQTAYPQHAHEKACHAAERATWTSRSVVCVLAARQAK